VDDEFVPVFGEIYVQSCETIWAEFSETIYVQALEMICVPERNVEFAHKLFSVDGDCLIR
jgi:hypothetical protein